MTKLPSSSSSSCCCCCFFFLFFSGHGERCRDCGGRMYRTVPESPHGVFAGRPRTRHYGLPHSALEPWWHRRIVRALLPAPVSRLICVDSSFLFVQSVLAPHSNSPMTDLSVRVKEVPLVAKSTEYLTDSLRLSSLICCPADGLKNE